MASNAYDLTPLIKHLNEVATAFPNEFPRAVRRKPKQPLGDILIDDEILADPAA